LSIILRTFLQAMPPAQIHFHLLHNGPVIQKREKIRTFVALRGLTA
jgi:hypothetical protein